VEFQLTLSMTESEFDQQKESIKSGVAKACNVETNQVELAVVARRNRRNLQDSVNIEAKITTDSTDAATVTNLIQDGEFATSLETEIASEGVTTTVSDVSAPTVTSLAANESSSGDDDDSDTTLYIIIAACVVVLLGLVAYCSHSCGQESKEKQQYGEASTEEFGGTPFGDIENKVL